MNYDLTKHEILFSLFSLKYVNYSHVNLSLIVLTYITYKIDQSVCNVLVFFQKKKKKPLKRSKTKGENYSCSLIKVQDGPLMLRAHAENRKNDP